MKRIIKHYVLLLEVCGLGIHLAQKKMLLFFNFLDSIMFPLLFFNIKYCTVFVFHNVICDAASTTIRSPDKTA